ncbi:hypothetical protein NDU88_007609 [Pleurodeles waltl]|uniref:Uncharacterized protein n=1 Tax=Pleurodeles waltl TaxID=8319 RepID=A0AAV7PU36_PLEWA|nr:hypothetical protein NDU88_007609 [Pleurodeles waltl]
MKRPLPVVSTSPAVLSGAAGPHGDALISEIWAEWVGPLMASEVLTVLAGSLANEQAWGRAVSRRRRLSAILLEVRRRGPQRRASEEALADRGLPRLSDAILLLP